MSAERAQKCADELQALNDWRRSDSDIPQPAPDPKATGVTIDEAISLLRSARFDEFERDGKPRKDRSKGREFGCAEGGE